MIMYSEQCMHNRFGLNFRVLKDVECDENKFVDLSITVYIIK